MIALIISILLTAVFLVIAFAAKDAANQGVPLLCLFLAITSLVVGVLLFPASRAYENRIALQSETNRARLMITVLGSTDDYIAYIKVNE